MNPATAEALEKGRELFNAGRYFEAHEAWEECWLREEGETRQLLQGLIQIAAGYYKALDQGHPRGGTRLLEAGLAKLRGVAAVTTAFDLDRFEREIRGSLDGIRQWAGPPEWPPRGVRL